MSESKITTNWKQINTKKIQKQYKIKINSKHLYLFLTYVGGSFEVLLEFP